MCNTQTSCRINETDFVLVDKNLIFAFKIRQQEQLEVFSWIMASYDQYDRILANDVQMCQQDTHKEKEWQIMEISR